MTGIRGLGRMFDFGFDGVMAAVYIPAPSYINTESNLQLSDGILNRSCSHAGHRGEVTVCHAEVTKWTMRTILSFIQSTDILTPTRYIISPPRYAGCARVQLCVGVRACIVERSELQFVTIILAKKARV